MYKLQKAFTLIELLVTMSIITVIMSVVLYNYGSFNNNLAMSGAAQEIAINVRQAQAYGINVKEATVGTGQFSYAFGIHFNTLTPNSYYIYVDRNSNNKYDGGTELFETINLRNGIRVANICDASNCPVANVVKTSINFLRPNPDARIYFINSSDSITSSLVNEVRIQLTSPKGGNPKYVTIVNTGQITVQ